MNRARVLRAAAGWLVLIAAVAALTRYDVPIVKWFRDRPGLADRWLVNAARLLAESWLVLIGAVLLIVIIERRRTRPERRAAVIICHWLLALLIGFNVVQLAKAVVVRERPYATFERFPSVDDPPAGASWLGIEPDLLRKATLKSFPSGHSTAAFAGAVVLAWFYPGLRVAFFVLATACACSRVVQGAHWPSDCLAGAAVGFASAWTSLRASLLTTPRRWFGRRAARLNNTRPGPEPDPR